MNCPIPRHGELKLYCEDCNTPICSDCFFFGSHKNHKCLDYSEVTDKCHADIHNSIQPCIQAATTLGDAVQSANDLIHQIQAQKRQEINSTFDGLQAVLSDRCKALLKESDNIATGKVTAVRIKLEAFSKTETMAIICQQACHRYTPVLSIYISELLSIKKTIEDRLDKLRVEFEEVSLDLVEDRVIMLLPAWTIHCMYYEKIFRYGKINDVDVAPSLSAPKTVGEYMSSLLR